MTSSMSRGARLNRKMNVSELLINVVIVKELKLLTSSNQKGI